MTLKGEDRPWCNYPQQVMMYLTVTDGHEAIAFYEKAFGARPKLVIKNDKGKVDHAELYFGDSVIMLAEEKEEFGSKVPAHYGGCSISINFFVPDVDTVFKNALAAGAKQIQPVEDQFYGDRNCIVQDKYGYRWTIATNKEELATEVLEKKLKT